MEKIDFSPDKIFDFHFNKEREHSIRLLYKFFCNNLFLGQWELASACLRQLHEEGHRQSINIRDVLQDIAEYPFQRSSSSVRSPHHLAWLCLQEKLTDEQEQDTKYSRLRREVEFRLLLIEAGSDLSETVIKELYLYHSAVIQQQDEQRNDHTQPLVLSSDLLRFLQKSLLEKPILGHALINSVIAVSEHSQFKKNNEVLQNLYIKVINVILDKLADAQNEADETETDINTLYLIFSLYDPEPYQNYVPLRELFTNLLKTPQIDKKAIISVLVGRTNTYLIEEFCKLDYEGETESEQLLVSGHRSDLTCDQKCIQLLVREPDRTKRLHTLFLLCLKKQQHLLKNVTETAISLIKNGMFTDLKELLEPEEFHPLKPLLLLYGWSFCSSVTQAKTLLEILWDRQTPFRHSALEAGCNKLAYQIDLIQWCLDRTKPLVSTEEGTPPSSINHQQRAADMFVGLENHSVLYVLHRSTRLASKNQQEVLNLLQNSPFEGLNGKKVKSVRFSEDGTKGHTTKDLHIERHKDTSIFNGFCAIKNVMDVIHFCSEYQDTHLMKPLHVTDFPSAKHFDDCNGTESGNVIKSSVKEGETFQDIYKENVTVKLENTKVFLSKLQPLTYRVEILENIFSLLFLTHEDIQESAITIDSDSDGVEDSESSCRDSMNGGIRTSTISEESVSPTTPNSDGKFSNHSNGYFPSVQNKVETSYDEPYIDQSKVLTPRRKTEKSSSGNVITKNEKSVKLKTAIIKDLDSSHRGSGNASTLSLDSISSSRQLGFLSNEYVVRDVLAMLKECLVDLNAAKFRILGKKNEPSQSKLKTVKTDVSTLIDVKLEEPLCHIVQSSVTMETLSNKIAQLSQYVHEAQWRFNLVSHENIPKKPGEVLLEPITVSRDMWNEEIDLDSLTSEFCTKARRRKRRTTSSSNGNKSSFSFDSPSETHSTDTTLDGEGKRKRRSRSHSRHRTRSKTNQQQPTGIIPLMLVSPDSLLNMCIRQGHHTHVTQVIKMLKLEDRSQSIEVDFTQGYNKAVKKLQGLNIGAQGHVTKATKPGKMSMKALASVAAVGVATVSVTTIADELLSSSKLPRIPHPRSRVTIPAKLQLCFQQENCPTLILFDLFCTACRTWEMCNNMVDVLKIKQPALSDVQLINSEMKEQDNDLESTKSVRIDQKMKSILDVVKQYENVLQLGAENETSHHHGQNDVLVALYKHSIQTFLQTVTLSLNPSNCLKYANFVYSMRVKLEKVDQMFKTFGKMPLEGYMHGSTKTSPRSMSSPRTSPRTSPKPSPTGRENITDKPVIHTAMKSLIQAMEKDLPQGGLCQLYLRNSGESFKNRDYLLNLYEHLKGLAFVVVENEDRNKESIVIPRNYFRMLDEGPIATLGRLIFSKKFKAARLEQVAKKLSLDLTQIIVHNCCSEIPSKQQRVVTSPIRDIQRCDNRICMNSTDFVQSLQNYTLPPDVTVRGILTKLLKMMKDTASGNNARCMFDMTTAELMTQTEEYRDIIKSTSKLELVNLDSLKNKEEKICFFGNLQNLMCLHMNLFLYELLGSEEEVDRTASSRTVDGLTIKPYCEMSVTDQISYMNMFSYRVGQMGVISFFDLRYIINRNGLIAPLEFDGLLQTCLYEIDSQDPWYKYIPPPEPRLLFTLTSCSQSSPPIQILVPEMVNNQLNMALKEYLNHSITVDKNRNTITVPQLLMWYKQDFSFDHNEAFIADNEGIIIFISEHTTGDVQSSVTELIQLDKIHGYSENIDRTGKKELPFNIGIDMYLNEFLIAFDYNLLKQRFQKTKGHRRITSLPKNLTKEFGKRVSKSNSKAPMYNLTPVTLQYVQAECPLVATLVSLVCADELDDIEEHLAEDYFSNHLRERTASEISLVDIRSYRYQKLTDDYRTLRRHVLSYVIPIAGAEDPEILKGSDPLLKLITSNMSEKVKACMLNLHDNDQFQMVVKSILNDLISDRKWSKILTVIDSFPSILLRQRTDLSALHDFTLSHLIHEKIVDIDLNDKVVTEVTSYICRFHCVDGKIRILLGVYRRLPIEHSIDLFEMCYYQCGHQHILRDTVINKLKELKMYYRITECAKNLQFKLSLKASDFISTEEKSEFHEALDKFTDWRKILSSSDISPEEVLSVLLRSGDFETAKLWCRHLKQPQEKYLEVVERHLVALLDCNPPNTTKAFMSLDSVKEFGAGACLELCQKLLEKMSNQRDVIFIISYMFNELESQLEDEQMDHLRLTYMGAKVLLCLPSSIRGEYIHLVSRPDLLLEQLLMNMKIDLAGKAFNSIKPDLVKVKDSARKFTQEQFDSLVSTYSRKAVEFIVVKSIETGDKERSPSTCSSASSDKLDTAVWERSPTKKSVLTESMKTQRRSIDISVSPRIASSGSPRRFSLNVPRFGNMSTKQFIMPTEPPPKDKWVPDNYTDTCMVCKVERFSMFNRRHHCRRCGRLVCGSCSTKTSTVNGISVRTCEDCYQQLNPTGKQLSRNEAEPYSHMPEVFSSNLSPKRNSPAQGGSVPTIMEETTPPSLADVIQHSQSEWKLQLEEEHNTIVREDFFYEQAPSTALCLSVSELHSNDHTCGQLMLQLCDDLSQHLKPIAPGVPNPEVDYSLVLSMMKTLLFHAKLKFIKFGHNQGMGQCDIYQSHIDLLGVLVADNYRDLPSLQELTKPDLVKRLRDKLIENERLQLAVEVSTKCGIDTSGVWSAWGMSCLQGGDFIAAREKFSRCLRAPVDKNSAHHGSKLLNDIINYLEALPGLGTVESYKDDASMDSSQYQECLYYLKAYGTLYIMVDFYRRNGYWMKAVQFIIDQRCVADVYMEGLFIPAMYSGEMDKLFDQMLMIDPSLEKWNIYLTTACRYLLKNKLHHILYEVQIFMKDFIRAAMTCITCFYLRGAQSYLDLAGRLHFLHKAYQHMQAYLDPSQWGSVKRTPPSPSVAKNMPDWGKSGKNSAETAVRLVQSEVEVGKHLRALALQIEVTKFLQQCLTRTEADSASVAAAYVGESKFSQLPTMFSSSKSRSDLVIMVLLSGNNIKVAFDLSNKIIKECNLAAVSIYTHAAREMAKHQRYVNVRELLDLIVKSGVGDDDMLDEIVGACILVIADNPSESKEAENLIKLLRKDSNKINAYILCGKLRSAYLMAVKADRVEDVQRIAGAAQRMGQTAVKNICNKWLQQRE